MVKRSVFNSIKVKSKMKIVIFGKDGQVGSELINSVSYLAEVYAFGKDDANFNYPDKIKDILNNIKPDVIINASAYTNVNKAEIEKEICNLINHETVSVIAECAKRLDAILIHYSTDYVYDGTKDSFYIETDKTNPLNFYGESKLLGEQSIISSECKYIILRTSWVYNAISRNFITTIIDLAKTKTELKIVDDQFGAPTSARLISDVTALIVSHYIQNNDSFKSGIFHLTSKTNGEINWYKIAVETVKIINKHNFKRTLSHENIIPISTEEYGNPVKRPKNSNLDCSKLENQYKIALPNWREQLETNIQLRAKFINLD